MLLAASTAFPATPDEAAANLEKAIRNLRTLEARFVQYYFSASVAEPLKESGEFYFQKPDLMRWEYKSPREKVFLYTAGLVQMYLPDEKQLTRSRVSRETSESDILGIFLGKKPLPDVYLIENTDFPSDTPGVKQLKLVPREEGDYTALLVEIDQKTWLLRRAIFVEWGGGRREFLFSRIRVNVPLSPKLFKLKVPPDCEIIDDDEAIKR
jgi:outer membrane lipoprotein carrier protein